MEKNQIANLKRPKYKTYIRFNKHQNIFEEIILSIEHQERLEHVRRERFERTRLECADGEYTGRIIQGDLVRVKDGSGNLDYDSGKKRHGIHPLFKEKSCANHRNRSFVYNRTHDWSRREIKIRSGSSSAVSWRRKGIHINYLCGTD